MDIGRDCSHPPASTRAAGVGGPPPHRDEPKAEEPAICLESWAGPWLEGDPHANFKAEVALWSKADPMETLVPFAEMVGLPVGAVCRYVLARWAAEGSAGQLELGPSMVERLWSVCDAAGDDPAAQLAAFDQLRQMISWLRAPLE